MRKGAWYMEQPIRLISTDFDGTIFHEFENPPIPQALQRLIADLQTQGAKWAINTGREMASLMEALGRGGIEVEPDYLVLVEREIYLHQDVRYVGLEDWNNACTRSHAELFKRVEGDLPRIVEWIHARFHARIYADSYSPFCLIASSSHDMDVIYQHLEQYCLGVPHLSVVRNDVYARFSHVAYNKGTALAELTHRIGITRDQVFAAGDHFNDLPMLSTTYAKYLTAPGNAVEEVKLAVRRQEGFVSELTCGNGVAEGLQFHLAQAGQKRPRPAKEKTMP
jgi:hydroxymethylpyrimidine pyrophosphatase-like HAD family hydrolase